MRKNLTALVITPEPAWPVRNGSDVRIHQLIRRMAEFSEFDVATIASPFVHVDPGETRRQLGARSLHVMRHSPPRKQIVALESLLTSKPMGFIMYRSEPQRNAVAALSARNRYDVCLVFGGICMAGYAADVQALTYVLDMCDDAALNKERRALVAGNGLARAFYRWQAKLIRSYLRSASPAFTRILASSAVDAESLSRYVDVPVVTVRNSVDAGLFHPAHVGVSAPHNPLLLFVGAMHYRPNRDAVRWFTSSVMPLILDENPGTRLQLVGPGSEGVAIDSPSVVALGFTENLPAEYRKCDVFICPLRVGTGIKNKMLEALSSGCAIVSTEIGIEGLAVRHEEHLLVANDPLEFAVAVNRLLREPELRKRLGKAARVFTEQSLSTEGIRNCLRAANLPDESLQERDNSDIRTPEKFSERKFGETILRDAIE
jgi:glycosyltransferase involved in cell wall biosynthesis